MNTSDMHETRADSLQRVAALMILLGEEASALILRELEPEEVRQITAEMVRLRRVDSELAHSALEQFNELVTNGTFVPTGGLAFVRRALASAFGEHGASEHIEELEKKKDAPPEDTSSIATAQPARFALLLKDEHPQTVALFLSRFDAKRAATILAAFPPDMRPEILYRLATIDQIAPSVVRHVMGNLDTKLKSLGAGQRETLGGVKMAADVCNLIENQNSDLILAEIEQKNQGLAGEIRNLMFVFEDLLSLDQETLKEIVPKLDRKNLVIALKGGTDKLRAHICDTLPRRAADMLRDEIESLGPMKIRAVEAAQRELIESLREMERDGAISLRASSESDYV